MDDKKIVISKIGGVYGYNVVVFINGTNINEYIIGHMSTIEEMFPRSEYKYICL